MAVTAPGPARGRDRLRVLPISLAAAVLGITLVALAVPRLVAGAVTAPFDETVRALGRGEAIDDKVLRRALGSRMQATRWIGDGQYFADTAALRFAAYQRDADSREKLDDAIAAHRAALARAPSQPFVWYRLALAQLLDGSDQEAVGDALRQSLATGRYEPRLLLSRIELALAVWSRLPDDVRGEFAQQIELAMRWNPRGLVDATRRAWRLAEVRAALAPHPALRARFNLLYERRRPTPVVR